MKSVVILVTILAIGSSALIPTPQLAEIKLGSDSNVTNTTTPTNTTKPILKSSFQPVEDLNLNELTKTLEPPKLLTTTQPVQPVQTTTVTQPSPVTTTVQSPPPATTTLPAVPTQSQTQIPQPVSVGAVPTYNLGTPQTTLGFTSTTIQGSYRLRLPFIPFRIRGNRLILSLCNTHIFDFKTNPKAKEWKVTVKSSTQIACQDDYDKYYINLLTQITSYEVDQSRLKFYKGKDILARAQRVTTKFSPSTKNIDGKWELQILNLPLQVSEKEFSFKGCNTNVLDYKVTDKGEITLKSKFSTRIGCNVDTDQLFINALERSKFYELGEVSFKLFDKYGEDTAYGTPYLV